MVYVFVAQVHKLVDVTPDLKNAGALCKVTYVRTFLH